MKALSAELHKSRRRYNTPVAMCISLIVLLWSTQTGGTGPERLAQGYSGLFYAVPVMNTVVMPLGTAVLASRIWDLESKEKNLTLLLTMESRGTLFRCKAIVGILQIGVVCLVEGFGIPVLGRLSGFTEVLDRVQLGWLVLCTFAADTMLFFLWLWLSIRFDNQVPTLACGMVGSLSGLFAAFMPPVLSYLLPWGYYVPLSAMGMDWNHVTRVTRFVPHPYPVWLLAVTAGFLAVFAIGAWQSLHQKEV